ncbi:MAG: FAD-dependent oxidoreductase [Mycobacteriales bacterium]|nr:MAG: hypothetical protein DLM56_01065 [Pseudonocardiales bacterium]
MSRSIRPSGACARQSSRSPRPRTRRSSAAREYTSSTAGPSSVRPEVEVDGLRLRADRFVLATGARPAAPPIAGRAALPYLTNENIFDPPALPEPLVVLGGGASDTPTGPRGLLIMVVPRDPPCGTDRSLCHSGSLTGHRSARRIPGPARR